MAYRCACKLGCGRSKQLGIECLRQLGCRGAFERRDSNILGRGGIFQRRFGISLELVIRRGGIMGRAGDVERRAFGALQLE